MLNIDKHHDEDYKLIKNLRLHLFSGTLLVDGPAGHRCIAGIAGATPKVALTNFQRIRGESPAITHTIDINAFLGCGSLEAATYTIFEGKIVGASEVR